MSSSSKDALKTFQLENNIVNISDQDSIFKFDAEKQKLESNGRPWKNNPKYFTKVKISAVALIKMVIHARSGGNVEVMGSLQGKLDGDTIIVMDTFILPVEGTETRVNAGNEANEYMVEFKEKSLLVGRLENIIGWYHSHPGYGCWLSGIDVGTQSMNQMYLDPFVAIVIDPHRTISAGKVEIGAFRTYPKDYKPPEEATSQYQSIPLNKIEDFGAFHNEYYQLEVSCFKSSLDDHLLEVLWNKYWVNTLSSSPLITNRDYNSQQISDLAQKIEQTEFQGKNSGFKSHGKKLDETLLGKLVKDSTKLSVEFNHGIISQVLKDHLFNLNPA